MALYLSYRFDCLETINFSRFCIISEILLITQKDSAFFKIYHKRRCLLVYLVYVYRTWKKIFIFKKGMRRLHKNTQKVAGKHAFM